MKVSWSQKSSFAYIKGTVTITDRFILSFAFNLGGESAHSWWITWDEKSQIMDNWFFSCSLWNKILRENSNHNRALKGTVTKTASLILTVRFREFWQTTYIILWIQFLLLSLTQNESLREVCRYAIHNKAHLHILKVQYQKKKRTAYFFLRFSKRVAKK